MDLAPYGTGDELARARLVAAADPRIKEATDRDAITVAETLAAGPELVRRWRHGENAFGRSVITAALAARRCGHPEPIPSPLLRALSEHFLLPEQRARATAEWFDPALAWARTPVRGKASPLTPVAESVGSIDGDRVSDLLLHHVTSGQSIELSDPVWAIVLSRGTDDACYAVGNTAMREHGRNGIAEQCFQKRNWSGDFVA